MSKQPKLPASIVAVEVMIRAKYEILTWDADRQRFTPQQGVRRGPWTQFGLRRALRKLQGMGYVCDRGDCAVLVQKISEGQPC